MPVTRLPSSLAHIAIGCLLLWATAAFAADTRNVLVLYSNGRLLPANVEGDKGLRGAVATSADVVLFDEFLDQPRFGGDSYERTMATYLRDKYAAAPPDIVVAGGDEALAFLLRYRAELFPPAPIIHMGIGRAFLKSLQHAPPDLIGVPVDYDFPGTIDLALRWQPGARKLLVVTGTSAIDRDWEARVRAIAPAFAERAQVEYLAGLPTAEVLQRLRTLGPDTVVFTPGYFQDGAGRRFTPRESVEAMAAASAAPVYGPFNTFIGAGIVGGRMPGYETMGRQAGEIVAALAAGNPPASLRLPDVVPADVHVDWRQARRWGVRERDIPPDAIVHFREQAFWETYRIQALIGLVVLLALSGLSVGLLFERRSLHRTASALKLSEERMTLASRAARLTTWAWDVGDDRIWVMAPLRTTPAGPADRPLRLADALDSVHPADRDEVDRKVRDAIAGNDDLDLEYRTIDGDGTVRWLATRGRKNGGNGRQLFGVALDITERRQAEAQAQQDRSALQHLARVSVLGQLSASLAHQLNQPLASIMSNAETAWKMLGRDQPDLAELRNICTDIVAADQRAADVIRRLTALFRQGEPEIVRLDLNALVRETLELVQLDLANRNVAVQTNLASPVPWVDGDRVQLQQVLLNLLANGADAMAAAGPGRRELTVETVLGPEGAKLCVADRGPGVKEEDLKNVFEPFWSTKPDGLGIGLAICRSVAAAHGGSITVQNLPAGGARFCLTLPVRRPA